MLIAPPRPASAVLAVRGVVQGARVFQPIATPGQ
jgi:hypothetical protein